MTQTFFTASVNVVGGTGQGQFWQVANYPVGGLAVNANATLSTVSVITPVGGPTFDWLLVDADGFGVAGRTGLISNSTTSENALVYPNGFIKVLNATVDGTYLFKFYAQTPS